MKILLVIILLPLLFIPVAAVGLHVLACDMHVAGVDNMRNKQASASRQGSFYDYCKLMAGALRGSG
jgi:hypothetical protein